MKVLLTVLLFVFSAICIAEAQLSTNNTDKQILSKLPKGLTLEQAEMAIGKKMDYAQPNPPMDEAQYYFDFEGMCVNASFRLSFKDATRRLNNARVIRDGLTINQRNQRRQEAFTRYVEQRRQAQNQIHSQHSITNISTSQTFTNR